MALAGTLKDFSLADIFQLIGLQKKTGILTLTNEKEVARILFMNGMVVGADTDSQNLENRLGYVLVKSNLISQEELEQALANQDKTLQRLGQVLVARGFIKSENLRNSLQTQTTQIIYSLFRWTDGEYHFQQQSSVDYDQENFQPITSESILMEGVRMLDEWPMIERLIPNFEVMIEKTERGENFRAPGGGAFSMKVDEGDSFDSLLQDVMSEVPAQAAGAPRDDLKLHPQQEAVLRLVQGQVTVQDLIDSSGMTEFDTCRTLFDLMEMELIKKVSRFELTEASKIIEEEHQIPFWIPASLITIIAVFCFIVKWNPVNHYFPNPSTVARSEPLFLTSTQFRLDKIAGAIDLFYTQKGRLPRDLAALLDENLVLADDLVDPMGRSFQYESAFNSNTYRLYGLDKAGRRSPDLLTRQKVFLLEQVTEDLRP